MPILGIQNTYVKKKKKKIQNPKSKKSKKYSLHLLPPRLKVACLPSFLAFYLAFPLFIQEISR